VANGGDVRSSLPVRKSGILCRECGQEIGIPIAGRTAFVKGVAAPRLRPDIDPGTAARDKHEARPEKFTRLGELGRDALGVENGRVLVGMLVSGSVRGESVFVDDMKEVSQTAGLRQSIGGFW
jgi:hypothetical protein